MTSTQQPPPGPAPQPTPPGPWQHQPPGPWQQQPPQPSNGVATGGFVTALVGAVLSLIPIVGTVSWLISPVGLVLSVIGLVFADRRRAGKGLAIAGIALGAFGILLCIIYTAAFANAVKNTPTYPSTAASAPPSYSYTAPNYPVPTYAAPAAPASIPGQFGSGTWEVGTGADQMPPGTYRAAAGSSSCYYERLSGLSGDFGSIIANNGEYNGGPLVVTIAGSDAAFKVNGDCVFVRR